MDPVGYDPLNFSDMLDNTEDEADPEFTMDWEAAAANAEDQADEDGYGNPMPEPTVLVPVRLSWLLR